MRSPRERVSTKKDERLKYFHVGERKRINKGGQGKAFTVLWLRVLTCTQNDHGFYSPSRAHIWDGVFSPLPVGVHMGSNQSISLCYRCFSITLPLSPLSSKQREKHSYVRINKKGRGGREWREGGERGEGGAAVYTEEENKWRYDITDAKREYVKDTGNLCGMLLGVWKVGNKAVSFSSGDDLERSNFIK